MKKYQVVALMVGLSGVGLLWALQPGMPGTGVLATGSTMGTKLPALTTAASHPVNDVQTWEKRISSYSASVGAQPVDAATLTDLAGKTSRLVGLVREAGAGEHQGVAPQPPHGGQEMMTLALSIDPEFRQKLGYSFVDFFRTQNPQDLDAMFGHPAK